MRLQLIVQEAELRLQVGVTGSIKEQSFKRSDGGLVIVHRDAHPDVGEREGRVGRVLQRLPKKAVSQLNRCLLNCLSVQRQREHGSSC